MSRPLKTGLDYFPHDTDAVGTEKLQSLMALHGPAGYCFYFVMLEKVFRAENARITCGKPVEKAGLARLMCISLKQFDAILETALEVGCFDISLYNDQKIITSNGVQRRLEKVNEIRLKERKRKELIKDKRERERENQTRKTPGKRAENSKYLNLFENLWETYPNKDGKKQALQHFSATVLTETDVEAIKKALVNYLQSEKVKNGFIKNGSTWFNNWQDWIEKQVEIKTSLKCVYDNNRICYKDCKGCDAVEKGV